MAPVVLITDNVSEAHHAGRTLCSASMRSSRKSLSDGQTGYSGSLPAHMAQAALHMLVSLRHAFRLRLRDQRPIKVMLKEPMRSRKVDEFVQLHDMKSKHEYGTIIQQRFKSRYIEGFPAIGRPPLKSLIS